MPCGKPTNEHHQLQQDCKHFELHGTCDGGCSAWIMHAMRSQPVKPHLQMQSWKEGRNLQAYIARHTCYHRPSPSRREEGTPEFEVCEWAD